MKKIKKSKLTINAETIKALDNVQLARAAGGITATCGVNCTGTDVNCPTVGYTVCICVTLGGQSCPCSTPVTVCNCHG